MRSGKEGKRRRKKQWEEKEKGRRKKMTRRMRRGKKRRQSRRRQKLAPAKGKNQLLSMLVGSIPFGQFASPALNSISSTH